jgi:hypothetical protein
MECRDFRDLPDVSLPPAVVRKTKEKIAVCRSPQYCMNQLSSNLVRSELQSLPEKHAVFCRTIHDSLHKTVSTTTHSSLQDAKSLLGEMKPNAVGKTYAESLCEGSTSTTTGIEKCR